MYLDIQLEGDIQGLEKQRNVNSDEKEQKKVLINLWKKRELRTENEENNLNRTLRNIMNIRKMKDLGYY